MSLYDEVYGIKYRDAEAEMLLLQYTIEQQIGKGFNSEEELVKWAHDHCLDNVLFSNMSHQFMCVSHKGEIMLPNVFEKYYGKLLFYEERVDKRIVTKYWHPEGFAYFNKARIASEQSDGLHDPLYYRDYTVPTGYYNKDTGTFNIAKPFDVFAAETGADTSHIYRYLEHVAGECTLHLLAWLRAKLLYPTVKTQVVPIFVSRVQGSGKTTFAEVICKGLFGKSNVIVSDQYDSSARFNADYADSLIVCLEEKEEIDSRNTAGALKSRSTATTIRKEKKGIDPIYQESYTDFIMTSNKDVPIKFDSSDDQRRFMVMESDPNFTRKTSSLADEVFTKLYGYDANYKSTCIPFVDDAKLIAQFKHELFSRQDIASVQLRDFPKTDAYKRCFTLPRSAEAVEIENIMRALAPFIKEMLTVNKQITDLGDLNLIDIVQYPGAVQYLPAYKDRVAIVALCRPLVFYDLQTNKPFAPATVERSIYDCRSWLLKDYGLSIISDFSTIPGGFPNLAGRYRTASAIKLCLDSSIERLTIDSSCATDSVAVAQINKQRIGKRLRVNSNFVPDENGCFETVNELEDGYYFLKEKTKHVQYLDTLLFESDEPVHLQQEQERYRVDEWLKKHDSNEIIQASFLYKERLQHALAESKRLFDKGLIARIVYSGAKSYHLLLRVSNVPQNVDEYRWLHGYLCTMLTDKLIFDESTSDPARLTRAPITMKRYTTNYGLTIEGEQKLVAEDWSHICTLSWRQLYEHWCNRPLKDYEKQNNKPLYPTREEYRVALEAIIDGSFWSDSKFDGNRQHLFFPAYRLIRVLGYSHNAAWDNVILPKLSAYKKPDEISYWQSRRDAKIIQRIDKDIDDYDLQWSEK